MKNKINRDYNFLRNDFLHAAKAKGAKIITKPIKATFAGQELALDFAWFGSSAPKKVLLSICATHGVEGYFGSASQTAMIKKGFEVPADSAVVFLHALNPFGMVAYRRFNEDNIDLNRNFLGEKPISNAGYQRVEQFVANSNYKCPFNTFYLKTIYYCARYGYATMKQAIAGGQSEFPKGIYYSGHEFSESMSILKGFIVENFLNAEKLFVSDIHSGLGEWAQDVLFWQYEKEHPKTKFLESVLEQELLIDSATGIGYACSNEMQQEMPKLLPNTDTYWILQEFGAYGVLQTFKAICEENAYHHAGGADLQHWTKQRLLEVFCPDDLAWQQQVTSKAENLLRRLLTQL